MTTLKPPDPKSPPNPATKFGISNYHVEWTHAGAHHWNTFSQTSAVVTMLEDSKGIKKGAKHKLGNGSIFASTALTAAYSLSKNSGEVYYRVIDRHGKTHAVYFKGNNILKQLLREHEPQKSSLTPDFQAPPTHSSHRKRGRYYIEYTRVGTWQNYRIAESQVVFAKHGWVYARGQRVPLAPGFDYVLDARIAALSLSKDNKQLYYRVTSHDEVIAAYHNGEEIPMGSKIKVEDVPVIVERAKVRLDWALQTAMSSGTANAASLVGATIERDDKGEALTIRLECGDTFMFNAERLKAVIDRALQ